MSDMETDAGMLNGLSLDVKEQCPEQVTQILPQQIAIAGKIESGSVIHVPEGQQKVVTKIELQDVGKFMLFPKLPSELRNKVFVQSVTPRNIAIKFKEFLIKRKSKNNEGTEIIHAYRVFGGTCRPPIMGASKEAYDYLVNVLKVYTKVPATADYPGFYMNVKEEFIEFWHMSPVGRPRIDLISSSLVLFHGGMVRGLSLDLGNISTADMAWVERNLESLTGLERLSLRVNVPGHEDALKEVLHFEAREASDFFADLSVMGIPSLFCSADVKKRIEFAPTFKVRPNVPVGGMQAHMEVWQKMHIPYADQQMTLDIGMMLDRCLRSFTRFPREVDLVFCPTVN